VTAGTMEGLRSGETWLSAWWARGMRAYNGSVGLCS